MGFPRCVLCLLMCVGAALSAVPLPGQDLRGPVTRWRIGVLFWHESPNDREALRGVRAALEAYGRDYELVVRLAREDASAARAILDSFQRDRVDLILAMGTQAALLAAEHPATTPVVYTAVTNPIESGVVADWSGSGGKLCGNSNWIAPDNLLRVFRLAVPGMRKLGVIRSEASGVVSAAEVRELRRELEDATGRDGAAVELVEEVVTDADSIRAATRRLCESGIDALWIPIDFTVYRDLAAVREVTDPAHVPLVSSSLRVVRQGAVAGVLVDYEMLGERAVVLALQVLEQGVDPGSLPVGRMRGYQVVVNPDAARRAGYELPLRLLVVADVILERGSEAPLLGDGPNPEGRSDGGR